MLDLEFWTKKPIILYPDQVPNLGKILEMSRAKQVLNFGNSLMSNKKETPFLKQGKQRI